MYDRVTIQDKESSSNNNNNDDNDDKDDDDDTSWCRCRLFSLLGVQLLALPRFQMSV